MMKKQKIGFLLLVLALVVVACEREDDEPIYPPTPISRLYVSFYDVSSSGGGAAQLPPVLVFPKVDGETLGEPQENPFQLAIRGSGIFFDPNMGRVFQGNRDRGESGAGFMGVKPYTVSNTGVLGAVNEFKDSLLNDPRDLLYDHTFRNLYVSSDRETNAGTIHVYYEPHKLTGRIAEERPKRLLLEARPWGLAHTLNGDALIVAMRGDSKQVWLIDNIAQRASGQVITPTRQLTINGASDLCGVAYSERLDLLAVTDYGSSRVYLFENARSAFAAGTASPTRTLEIASGGTTGGAIDVAIDDRDGRHFLFVLHEGRKAVLRYPLDASGTAGPEASYEFTGRNPVAIYLDARQGTNDAE